jgi:hypothetical protein
MHCYKSLARGDQCLREQPDLDMGAACNSDSISSKPRKANYMKRIFLLGLAALALVVLAPTGSKADEGFRIYIGPGDQRPDYREEYPRYPYYRHPQEYRWHRWHRSYHRYYYDPDTGRYYYQD